METDSVKDSTMTDFKVPSLPFKTPASKADTMKPPDSESEDQTVPEFHQEMTAVPEPPAETPTTPTAPAVQYEEPSWGGPPPNDKHYSLEILKAGIIVNTIKLTGKSFFTVGR